MVLLVSLPVVTSRTCAVPQVNRSRLYTEVAALLVAEMSADPHGEFSLSVYETGRLVRHAPSLPGHAQRVRFLLDEQQSVGGWGGLQEYGIVPTLSAIEALLAIIRGQSGSTIPRDKLANSVNRGLTALFELLNTSGKAPLPDTVGVEIVVPGLIAEINAHLNQELPPGLGRWEGRRLVHHAGANDGLLSGLRGALVQGHALPMKLAHILEVFGDTARGAWFVEPVESVVGCSPAATAVWLGDGEVRAGRHSSVRYLEEVQARGGGPVPTAAPLPVFERAWVLLTLASVGLVPPASRDLARGLHTAFGELGVAGGAGLPPDADDTATALTALARLGSPRSPDCLLAYQEQDGHFACFFDERTPSTSTNAHVLQAFGACLTPDLPGRSRYEHAMARLTDWLCDRQESDGSWWDKWHASPYYATACAALALSAHGGDRAVGALRRAVGWVLDTQRPDGSWGWWAGTVEETAYAVQILSRVRVRTDGHAAERAVAKGYPRLLAGDDGERHTPLWHDKDLYTPLRIVRAERLAALCLAEANPQVVQLVAQSNIGCPPGKEL
jgi:halimadienyl-diphosphate synthase